MPPSRSVSSSNIKKQQGQGVSRPYSNPVVEVDDSNPQPLRTPVKNAPPAVTGAASVSSPGAAFKPGSTPIKFNDQTVQQRSMNGPKSVPAPSVRARNTVKPTSYGFSLRKLAVQLTALYALIAYFVICPNDPSRAPAVCKSYNDLQQYRHQAISYFSPYVQPYITMTYDSITPITDPYVQAASPYYSKAAQVLQPQVQRANLVYAQQIRPRVVDAVTHSQKRAHPHLDRLAQEYNKRATPYLKRYSTLAEEIYDINVRPYVEEVAFEYERKIKPFYAGLYARSAKQVNRAFPVVQHHARNTVYPLASSTYSTSVKTYNNHVHPHLISSAGFLGRLVTDTLAPSVGRFQSRYIAPQLSKIQDKAWAYKAKKVADEKVLQMDADLGKEDIQDEIDELLSEIRSEATTVSPAPDATTATAPIEPTAVDDAGLESKNDILSEKLLQDAEKARVNREKRRALEALHDLYEVEIAKLGETELALLADRLAHLRKTALRDIPNRFDPALKGLQAECDKWVGRMEKYWEKAARDERTPLDTKVADGDLVARKALVKIADAADEVEDEVDGYQRTHSVRETTSVEKAYKTVSNFVGKAQEELGTGYAWLDDVTAKDWTRYHTLAAMEGSWHHSLFGLKNGSISHASLDKKLNVDETLTNIKRKVHRISEAAEQKVESARQHGGKVLKGEFLGVVDTAKKGAAVIAEAFDDATRSASSLVGVTPTPTDLQGTASSVLSVATESAASLYADSASSLSSLGSEAYSSASSIAVSATEIAPSLASQASQSAGSLASAVGSSIEAAASSISSALLPSNVQKALDDAQNSLASAYGEASQTLLRAAGVQPSPTDMGQSANSVLAQASAFLAEVQGEASSLLGSYASEASKTAMSLAGQPTATGYQASAESALSQASASASSYADALASDISAAASNAQMLVAKIAGDAYSVVPAIPGTADLPAVSDITSTISSQVHQATREAFKAAGISVTPESLQEHAESVYSQAASGAASGQNAAAAVLDDLSSSIHSGTRAAAKAAGFTPSPESPAEYAESVYAQATQAAASAGSSAASLAGDVSSSISSGVREAAKAAGYSPSPESPAEYAESVYGRGAAVAASIASQATVAAPSASKLSSSVASLYEEISATASSAIDAASSAVHSATRSVAKAVGADVTPEGVGEYVAAAASSASSIVREATQAVRERAEL